MLIRPTRRELLQAGGVLAGAALVGASRRPSDPWAHSKAIVASIRPPVFPPRTFSITDFGARGDGTTLATESIRKAIAACAAAGGGRVLVPAGRFLTGAVHLKSNVELHVARGATLLFSTDPAHYPLVQTRWEGIELINYSPLIYAYGQRNIALTGEGTLDGQADAKHWWPWKGPWEGTVDHGWREGMADQRPARARLAQMAEAAVPVEKRVFGNGSYLRPAFVEPYRCDNVLIEGVKLRGAPFWQVHPVLCRNVIVRNLDIYGHGPNNDGCDPESCSLVLIEGCTFDTGDDCIAVKSGRDADGRRLHTPSEDILIRNCRMKEGHGGLTIGSEISGGARRIYAENCLLDSPHLMSAIRFKNNALRGGVLEDFHYRDIIVGQIAEAVVVCDFNYEEGAKGPYTPVLRHVSIERLRATHAKRVLDSQGLPKAPIHDIRFSDCRFDGVTEPSIIRFTDGVTLDHVMVNGRLVRSL